MTTEEIIKDWLKTHGYDGLYRDDDEDGCGCNLDDFMPCLTCPSDGIPEDCKAGYKQKNGGIGEAKNES